MTLEELQAILGITIVGTPQQERYELLLAGAIDEVQAYCNQTFEDENGEVSLPPAIKVATANLTRAYTENPAVQSQRLGDMEKSFFEGGSMKAVFKTLKRFRRLVFT